MNDLPSGAISDAELESYLWRTTWTVAPTFTLRQAACLLAGFEPSRFSGNRTLPQLADSYLLLLRRAVKLKALPVAELLLRIDGELIMADPKNVSIADLVDDATAVERDSLRRWCADNRKPWPFADEAKENAALLEGYPVELRAAIEAFEAVSRDPLATVKQTPKAALAAWLAQHKPDLTASARERIAIVANWQPQGGAPKTPG